MKLSDFDFDLPEDRIALRPVRPRSRARLLVAQGGGISDSTVDKLDDWLRPGDLLVFNDTRVLAARLRGTRTRETTSGTGRAAIEVTLLRQMAGNVWQVLAKPARKLAVAETIAFDGGLSAEVLHKADGGVVELRFSQSGDKLQATIEEIGAMPLPPYIASRRPADARDRQDYQTVFAANPGAVAAPTASLHFDARVLERLQAKGVRRALVTLHVGAGTFLPVKTDNIDEHEMHVETGELGDAAALAISRTKADGGRVIPVGTTALRVIETAAVTKGEIRPWRGDTGIFIKPGYRFKIADALMTNFHLPKSTLLMLVAALMGRERTRRIYDHAIAEEYRFYSYGDTSLLLP